MERPLSVFSARLAPTPLALAAAVGVACQLLQPRLWPAAGYAAVAACAVMGLVLVALRIRHGRSKAALLLGGGMLITVLLAFALAGAQAVGRQAQRLAPALEGQDLQLVVVVDAMPVRSSQGQRLRLVVEQAADAQGQTVALPALLEVMWFVPRRNQSHDPHEPRESREADEAAAEPAPVLPTVHAGERWRLAVRLKAPHGARNPHGFDWELWLWEQGVGATGYVREGGTSAAPQRLDAGRWRRPVEAARQSVRDAILARATAVVDAASQPDPVRGRALGVVAALVTGDQRAIETADWDVFRRTGVAHLVSISGLHITLFAWLAAALIGRLWRRSARLCLWWPAPLAALWSGVALAGAYALFSGWGVPAQRTVLMLAVVALLRSGGWRWPWHAVWAVALAVIALWDPWALCQAGFWLSFVAVGVLLAAGRGDAEAPGGVRGWMGQLLREQGLVVLALSPLSLLFFGQVSVVGAVANLLAIPWVTWVVTPLSLLGVGWHGMWEVAAWAVQAMVWVLEWLAHWSWASVQRPQAPWWAAVAAVLAGVLLVLPWPWRWRVVAVPLLWPALWWQPARPAPGMFDLLALDVGQGSAILLRTAGHSLLFDAGPAWSGGDAGSRAVQPLLQAWGETLDVLLLSHSDLDHIGGAASVLAAQPQARLMGAGAAELAASLRLPWQPCVAGQQWQWDGVLWQVLHPAVDGATHGNPSSCVLRVQAANGASVLLTGDIEAAQEKALLRSGQTLQADLLVAPHHGSRTSSSAAFLAAVAPRGVVIQAGYRNRYGHPAAPVVQRYAALDAVVQATPQSGAVHWRGEQPGLLQCERSRYPHYWSYAPER